MKLLNILLVGILFVLLETSYAADDHKHSKINNKKKKKHHYEDGAPIEFWVNNVGPHANPTETYEFYSLPYCKPTKNVDKNGALIKKQTRMGQVIQGDRAVLSDYELRFNRMYNSNQSEFIELYDMS